MNRYKISTGELLPKKVRSWLRKELKKNENMNLISHTENSTSEGNIRTVLIFEDPLATFEAQLQTAKETLYVDDDDPELDEEA